MYDKETIRGTIKYLGRFKQVISFEGMERMRKITPTDIDGFIDYGGRVFVYFEFKKEGKGIDRGQQLALENLVRSHEKAGHKACAMLVVHNNEPNETIVAKHKQVVSVYRNRKGIFNWVDTTEQALTLLEAIEWWEKMNNLK